MVRQIPLTQGKVALVDDDDYERLSSHKWHAVAVRRKHGPSVFYAARTINGRREDGSRTAHREYMHRVVLGIDGVADHRDGDGLNNQRSNLRPATTSQNGANRRRGSASPSSRFKGVCWHRRCRRWQAGIRVQGQSRYIGFFTDEEEAARAYDRVAREAWGEFALVNFPEVTQ
jgi:hypothetical protein